MTDLPPTRTPFHFGLSKNDRAFTFVVIGIIVIAIVALISGSRQPALDIVSIQMPFISPLSLAVLSALVFVCIYAYLLFQNSHFLFMALAWLAHLVYTICIRQQVTESQRTITFIVALTADVPLFLSSFSEKQRKWWIPVLPIAVILFSLVFYGLSPAPPVDSEPPSDKLLILYLLGPISSMAFLVWLAYALYFRDVLDSSIKHIGAYSLAFVIYAILQLPFTLQSLCHFWPSLFFCPSYDNRVVIGYTQTGTFGIKLAILLIVFFIIKDRLTGLKSAERQLKIKGEFEELGFFAASIEHELRNPLEVVRLEIEFLKGKTQSNEELQSRFGILERQLNRMSVAADIINVLRSKRENIIRKLRPVPVTTHVNQAIKYVKRELNQQAANITFKVEEHTKELIIEAFPPLLEQCLVNLLKNSVESINKSKKSGEIVIELFLKEKFVVAISVRDNGGGFIVEDIPKLTDPAYTKKLLSNMKSNRGLGLFVCDKIVSLHEGQLSFSNYKTGGAVVTLEFPRYITKRMQKVSNS